MRAPIRRINVLCVLYKVWLELIILVWLVILSIMDNTIESLKENINSTVSIKYVMFISISFSSKVTKDLVKVMPSIIYCYYLQFNIMILFNILFLNFLIILSTYIYFLYLIYNIYKIWYGIKFTYIYYK